MSAGLECAAADAASTAVRSRVGLGLRWEFLEAVLEGPTLDLDFFEVSPENYMRRGGYYPAALEQLRERYPLVSHGLSASLGAADPPPRAYLDALAAEVSRLGSPWHSDHVCFSSAGARALHQLLPLQFCCDSQQRVADRVCALSDRLGVPVAVENISYYVHPGEPELSELDFLCGILEASGAGLLLDVNNVYVNAYNLGFDARDFIRQLPLERVVEVHVAGHERLASGLLLDTHGAPVSEPVFELLEWTLRRMAPVPVLLERDNHVPELAVLLAEAARIRSIADRARVGRQESRAAEL